VSRNNWRQHHIGSYFFGFKSTKSLDLLVAQGNNNARGEAEGNIEVERKQISLFPMGPVTKCFVIPSNSKIENKTAKKTHLPGAGWLTNLPWFQRAWPNHVQVKNSR